MNKQKKTDLRKRKKNIKSLCSLYIPSLFSTSFYTLIIGPTMPRWWAGLTETRQQVCVNERRLQLSKNPAVQLSFCYKKKSTLTDRVADHWCFLCFLNQPTTVLPVAEFWCGGACSLQWSSKSTWCKETHSIWFELEVGEVGVRRQSEECEWVWQELWPNEQH